MKKLSLFLCLTTAFLLIFTNSCKKDIFNFSTDPSNSGSKAVSQLSANELIQFQEVVNWVSNNVGTNLNPAWDKAMQSVVNGHHVIQLPTSADAALFFTKVNGVLDVYAYKWLDAKPGEKTFTGMVFSYSFQESSASVFNYTKGKLLKNNTFNLSSSKNQPLKTIRLNSLPGSSLKKLADSNSGLPDIFGWLWCLLRGGSWTSDMGCNIFGDDGSSLFGSVWNAIQSLFNSADGGSGGGTYNASDINDGYVAGLNGDGGSSATINAESVASGQSAYVAVTINVPCIPGQVTGSDGTQSFSDPTSGDPDPCPNGYTTQVQWVSWTDASLINETDNPSTNMEAGNGEGDADADVNDNTKFDNTTYSDYDPQTMSWPTITNVLKNVAFVPFVHGVSCLVLAKNQIAPLGYKISDFGAVGQTIKTYNEANGANAANFRQGVAYINSQLAKGSPVIVGVDILPGQQSPPFTDNSTDHFVVIVGAGTDSKGNYYRFYDNATSDSKYGASEFNRLYYDGANNLITGETTCAVDNPDARALPKNANKGMHPYIVTQVRKNKTP